MSNVIDTFRPALDPRVVLSTTRRRETAPPAGRRFGDALASASSTILGGVEAAAGFHPAGAALSAAVRGSAPGGPEAAATVGAPPGLPADGGSVTDEATAALRSSQMDARDLLLLQSEIGMQQQRFSTLSNVMKARHETAKAVIGNVR